MVSTSSKPLKKKGVFLKYTATNLVMRGLIYIGRKQMTNVVYRNILITLLATSVFFNALASGVSYQLKHKISKKKSPDLASLCWSSLLEEEHDLVTVPKIWTLFERVLEAAKHWVDHLLIAELLNQESNFRPFRNMLLNVYCY